MSDIREIELLTIKVLLEKKLSIPEYQRPYRWSKKSVRQLIDDIQTFTGPKEEPRQYRIGTIILHTNGSTLDIVDGQQRFLTFVLIAHALNLKDSETQSEPQENPTAEIKNPVGEIRIPAQNREVSGKNLRANFAFIEQVLGEMGEGTRSLFKDRFLNQCVVVCLFVDELSTAFQLFDSQNSRGRPLLTADLLKAFHLREIASTCAHHIKEKQAEAVCDWKDGRTDEINQLLSDYLFPIRQWSVNLPASSFAEDGLDHFKGARPHTSCHHCERYPWEKHAASLIPEHTVDDTRFQIIAPIVNGVQFFKLTRKYLDDVKKLDRAEGLASTEESVVTPSCGEHLDSAEENGSREIPGLSEIFEQLHKVGLNTGNLYARELYRYLLLAYIDRFGTEHEEFSAVARKLAQYAFLLRVYFNRIQRETRNNHAIGRAPKIPGRKNMFREIAEALAPRDVLRAISEAMPSQSELKGKIDASNGNHQALRELYNIGDGVS